MNKKLGWVVASVAAVSSLTLAGCGGGTSSSEGSSESGGGSTSSASSSNQLTVWAWDPVYNIYALQVAEEIYQKDHPDFKLDVVEMPWDDVQTKLTTLAQSGQLGELPDIFLMQHNAFDKNFSTYPEIFTGLNSTDIDWDDYPDWILAYTTFDDEHYGVDFGSGTAMQALRTDILADAGFTVDDFTGITWDQFIEQGKVVKEKTGKAMLATIAGQSDIPMILLQSAGASLFDAEGQPTIIDNDALHAVVEVYKELVDSGVMTQVNAWDEYVSSFVNGNVAAVIDGVWIAGSMQTAEDQSGLWEITDLPALPGISGATNYSANGGSAWVISPEADFDLAADFLSTTFAGSVELYDTILPSSGAMSTWLPGLQAPAYKEPQPFFSDQPIYEIVGEFSEHVPSNNTGAYYYEARDAVSTAITQVIAGTDLDDALTEAQQKTEFAMN